MNAATFRNLGATSFAKGEKMPLTAVKSWQEKAFLAGFTTAAKAAQLANKSYTREQRKMDAIVARGAAKLHTHQVATLNTLTRSERRASMQFVSHNIIRAVR